MQIEHNILGLTVSKDCVQNTRMQYLIISFISDIYLKHLKLESAVSFANFFSEFFHDSFYTFYTWKTQLGPNMVKIIKPSCQGKAVFI